MRPLTNEDDLIIAGEWFKDHKVRLYQTATLTAEGAKTYPITNLVWARPGSSIYRIDYLIYGATLFVTGDVGDAVYRWSEHLDLNFLAHLDTDYFGSKCMASDSEPRGKHWDEGRVKRWIEEKLAQWAEENPIVDISGPEETECSRLALTFKQCRNLMLQEYREWLDDVMSHPGAWAAFCADSEGLILSDLKVKQQHYLGNSVEAYPRMPFDDDYRVGYTWSLRTRSHLVGLKLAYEQLQQQKQQLEQSKPTV